jgi:hypothetical protein
MIPQKDIAQLWAARTSCVECAPRRLATFNFSRRRLRCMSMSIVHKSVYNVTRARVGTEMPNLKERSTNVIEAGVNERMLY